MSLNLTPRQIRDLTETVGHLRKDQERLLSALKSNGFNECRTCGSLDARPTVSRHPLVHIPTHLSFSSRHWCSACLEGDEHIFDHHDDELFKLFKGDAFSICQAIQPFASLVTDHFYYFGFAELSSDLAMSTARRIFQGEEDRTAKNQQRFSNMPSPLSLWEMFVDILKTAGNYEPVLTLLARFGGKLSCIHRITEQGLNWNDRACFIMTRAESTTLAAALRAVESQAKAPATA